MDDELDIYCVHRIMLRLLYSYPLLDKCIITPPRSHIKSFVNASL